MLLILAAVSITALTDEDKGVVTKAKQAAAKTEDASEQEDNDIREIIDYAESEIEDLPSEPGNRPEEPEKLSLEIYGLFPEESCHLEDRAGFSWSNPFAAYNTQKQEFQYDEDMTWREWVASSYNTENYKIITTTNAGAGRRGECIVTSTSDNEDGEQLRFHGFEIAYDDPGHTTIATDEDYIGGAGKVWICASDLVDLDEKIVDTLEYIATDAGNYQVGDKYLKVDLILALTYYDD